MTAALCTLQRRLPCPRECGTEELTSDAHCTAAQMPGLCLHSIPTMLSQLTKQSACETTCE